jgi:arsenate reductase
MKTVVFACVHNAGRSQMAATFFNQLADPRKAAHFRRARIQANRVYPEVVEVMREAGICSSCVAQRPSVEAARSN